jgi:hypothetical protein
MGLVVALVALEVVVGAEEDPDDDDDDDDDDGGGAAGMGVTQASNDGSRHFDKWIQLSPV